MGHRNERLGWKPKLTSHNASIQNERHKEISWDEHSSENLGARTRVRVWVSMVLQSQSFSADRTGSATGERWDAGSLLPKIDNCHIL